MTAITNDLPWLVASERVYGPLADALGLRPARDAFETWCELAAAQFGEVAANLQVAGVFATGTFDGMGRLARGLERLRSDGQTIRSATEFLRVSLRELDGAMHGAMLSEPGLAATAASVRATSRRRSGLHKLSALGAEALGQPTRVEVDEAFREIQQLKRELRKLERAVARAGTAGSTQ